MAKIADNLFASDGRLDALKGRFPITLTIVLAVAADSVIVVAWFGGIIDTPSALGAHVLAAWVLCGAAALLSRRARALHVLRFLMLLVLGPLGGGVLLCLDLGRRLKAHESYPGGIAKGSGIEPRNQPRQSQVILAAMRQGRRPVPSKTRPSRFFDTFESGDLVLQNAAIAAISRRYSPEMLPSLMAALNSPVPAVRVQAAAVFAKLRNYYGERAKALLATTESGGDGNAIAALAAECASVARSGFLDTATAAHLRSRGEALARLEGWCPCADPGLTDERTARGADTTLAPQPALKRYSCGGIA